MKTNKKGLIIISIIILIIVSIVIAYMFFYTDTFKSKQELFAKYFAQNAQSLEEITDFQTKNIYNNLEYENKYNANTEIKVIHSEGGEVSNSLNNLSGKINIQKDEDEQYVYANGQILYDDEEYLKSEIIKEQEIYGVRFPNAVKQFIAIKNEDDFSSYTDDMGININKLQTLIDIIDGNKQTFLKENIPGIKGKYVNLITTTISKGTFEKQKNAMITYNNTTTKTNAYTVALTSNQVREMLVVILENVKSEPHILQMINTIDEENELKWIDELIKKINEEYEIPEIRITVYEQNQKTLRTTIDIVGHKIEIENVKQDEGLTTKINYTNLNNDYITQYNITLGRKNTNNQEKINMVMDVVEGDQSYKINISSEMNISDDKIELGLDISHKQEITTVSLQIKNVVNKGENIEKQVLLQPGNNVLINDIEPSKRKEFIEILKKIIPEKMDKRFNLLKEKLGMTNDELNTIESEEEGEISQVEINKFNSKFEFYTGEQVSADNVKSLLEIVKNNLSNYEIIKPEIQEDNETNVVEEKFNIKLKIEKDKLNEDIVNQLLEQIKDNKQYKVIILYSSSNGLIEYITITEI